MAKKLEKEIQLEICEWLSASGFFFWRFRYMSRFPIKFIPRGLPDIMILAHGHFFGVEVKVPDYWKHTDKQKNIGDQIIAHGGSYIVATSLEEVIKYMGTITSPLPIGKVNDLTPA